MRNQWVKLLVFIFPIVFIAFVNIVGDTAGVINDESKDVASYLINGNCVAFPTGNINEVQIKKNLIKSIPDKVDCISIGPSLIMGVRDYDVKEDIYYNFGHSSANLYDELAQFGCLEYNNKKYDKVVICLDYFNVDFKHNRDGIKDKSMSMYADYMIDLINGKIAGETVKENCFALIYNRIKQIFSLSYFKQSIRNIFNRSTIHVFNDTNEECKFAYYKPDGSYVYPQDFRTRKKEDMLQSCQVYDVDGFCSRNMHCNKDNLNLLEKLVKYLVNKGIQVKLFLCPHPPVIWDKIVSDGNYYMPYEIDEFAIKLCKIYGCTITGSHNPNKIGITNEEFYDATHVRHEKLSEYMDFTFSH